LENLDNDVDINRAWETIRQNIKITVKESLGFYELREHNLWFDEKCSKILDQRKQVKLKWLQNPIQVNEANLNNVRSETADHGSQAV
jgi:hypothetical protein